MVLLFNPIMQSFATVIVALTFCLGWFLLIYWTIRLVKRAIYYNLQTSNAAPVSICLMLAISTSALALFAAMGVWQLYAGLYA